MTTTQRQESVGQGGYGTVVTIPGRQGYVRKRFSKKSIQELQRVRALQRRVDQVDPFRQHLGAKIVQFDPQGFSIIMKNDGVDLYKYMRTHGSFAIAHIFHHFTDILEALVLLENARMVYGDLKTSNVLRLDTTGQLKIIDFDFLGSVHQYQVMSNVYNKIYPNLSKDTAYFVWPWERYFHSREMTFSWKDPERAFQDLVRIGLFSSKEELRVLLQLLSTDLSSSHKRQQQTHHRPTFQSRFAQLVYTTYFSSSASKIHEIPTKIDIYGAGLIAFECFLNEDNWKTSLSSHPQFGKRLSTIIFHMIHPNPLKRKSATKILSEWRHFRSLYPHIPRSFRISPKTSNGTS